MSIDHQNVQPLPRCCAAHPDWTTLGVHLREDFGDLPADLITEELLKARRAVDMFAVDSMDGLQLAELIVRHQLLISTGRAPDIAKLDPQTHARRSGDGLYVSEVSQPASGEAGPAPAPANEPAAVVPAR